MLKWQHIKFKRDLDWSKIMSGPYEDFLFKTRIIGYFEDNLNRMELDMHDMLEISFKIEANTEIE